MNTNMTGFRWFSKDLCILVLWMKVALALEGLKLVRRRLDYVALNFSSSSNNCKWNVCQGLPQAYLHHQQGGYFLMGKNVIWHKAVVKKQQLVGLAGREVQRKP